MIPLWLLFVLVGAAGGFTAGLFGVGGGLVIVPTLYFLWHTDPVLGPEVMHFAVATSLACIVVTSLTSSWTHWRAKRLQFDRLHWLALAVSLGSITAVWLANWLPSQWLKLGFGLFALSTCLSLLRPKKESLVKPIPQRNELLGAGAFIGHLSTLLGVSGGAMTVPYLVLRGVDMRQAVVVSSAVAIPISLIGAVGLALTGPHGAQTWGYVHWPAFVGISLVSIMFANWGARLSQRMDKRKLQMAFAGFLALVAAHMLLY
ncbi:sulfite exporter TauE/SafE family protein [Limnohabitans sp. DM1]|uniref:sulfite exporter TauE/SafE family protein n=1 Tax=Limnohabitans sp. DM1 TaxID=1597955 RepID=UPI000A8A3AE8|nr:sulfite exporter TauE/SafE family protein [Limnohabitans sp. DM1]